MLPKSQVPQNSHNKSLINYAKKFEYYASECHP